MTYKRTPLQIALRKRQEALNSIEVRKRSIAALEARVAALDAEIAAMGGRKITLTPRLPFRAKGEMQRELFDLLRRQKTATAADLATIMLGRFSLDAADSKSAYAMRQRCTQAFKRCERNGLVRQEGWSEGKRRNHGRFKVWALAGPKGSADPMAGKR
jgi:hypothetical protein